MHDYRDDDDKKVINNIFQFAKLRRIRNGTAPVEPKENYVFYNCVFNCGESEFFFVSGKNSQQRNDPF